MSVYDADPAELRVLGCLLEKQKTTPDAYPLSLNALRLACNQSTNRDPIVEYGEGTIRDALDRLSRRRWARLASGAGSRAVKYRHLFGEALHLDGGETALLCVLMLRGPQTVNELRTRTERLHGFVSGEALQASLDGLADRELAELRLRRPGQREDRWAHLLGTTTEPDGGHPADEVPPARPTGIHLGDRVEQLEATVNALEDRLARLERGDG